MTDFSLVFCRFTLVHIPWFACRLAVMRLLSVIMLVRILPFHETGWEQFSLSIASFALKSPAIIISLFSACCLIWLFSAV